jgi:hypothetical protein
MQGRDDEIRTLQDQLQALEYRLDAADRLAEAATQVRRGAYSATLTEKLEKGSSATATIRRHDGTSYDDTTETIEVYDDLLNTGDEIPADAIVVALLGFDGKWLVVAAQCQPEA